MSEKLKAAEPEVVTVNVEDVITRIEVYPVKRDNLLATVKLYVADFFVINCFLRQGRGGPYLNWPSHLNKRDNTWVDDVIPTSYEVKKRVTQLVVEAYRRKEQSDMLSMGPLQPTSSRPPEEPGNLPF